MSRPSTRLAALAAALCVAAAGLAAATGALGSALPCGVPGAAPCVRVLFLGNSYTYVNDLPAMLRDLAASKGQRVVTGMQASGGATLADHAASAADEAAIASSAWQFVVFQEQSQIPAAPGLRERTMFPAARTLATVARTAGGQVVLFETWAHAGGLIDYGMDYQRMQESIDGAYTSLGSELGAIVVPVGEAWSDVHRRWPGIALWQSDGSHPTVAGTYLAACVFFARLFDRSLEGAWFTGGLSADTARNLQAAAARAVGIENR